MQSPYLANNKCTTKYQVSNMVVHNVTTSMHNSPVGVQVATWAGESGGESAGESER